MKKHTAFTTRLITFTAMMTALVMVSGFIPPLEIPPIGRIYWCDGVIFLGCFLFAPLSSFIIFPSLAIHGLQAFLVSFLLHKIFPKKHEPLFAFSACLVGAAIVIAGYFLVRILVQNKGIDYALIRMPSDVIQEAAGIAAAMFVCYGLRLKSALLKSGLLPEIAVKKNSGETEELPEENNENPTE